MSAFSGDLVRWYRQHARDLPWRQTRDPYRIWVSEIMLQQTQVDTVIPYYHRFFERFPTMRDLAEAPTDDVLKAWEGLGYYSRGRNLQKAAQEVMALYDGRMPDDPVALRALPGIGEYTVGAIASIAFGRPVAAVDGNVLRVVSRIAAWDHDIAKPAAKAAVGAWVGERFPVDAAGDFTQALMELGATVCTPQQPTCGDCPVAAHCQALARGLVATLPVKSRKAPPRVERSLVAIIGDGDHLLIQRRPPTGLLAGLWEFPTVTAGDGEAERELAQAMAASLGVGVEITAPLTSVQHTFTHIRMTYDAFGGRLAGERPETREDRRWVTLAELDALAFSKAQLKLIAVLRQGTLLGLL
jgi:A/G-specific adenine glycosylase